jgi:hypothetical protein
VTAAPSQEQTPQCGTVRRALSSYNRSLGSVALFGQIDTAKEAPIEGVRNVAGDFLVDGDELVSLAIGMVSRTASSLTSG